jgi:hypothetical protein
MIVAVVKKREKLNVRETPPPNPPKASHQTGLVSPHTCGNLWFTCYQEIDHGVVSVPNPRPRGAPGPTIDIWVSKKTNWDVRRRDGT